MSPGKRSGRWNGAMQRVDAGYLYELGDAVRCLRRFRLRAVPAYEIWEPLTNCRQRTADFLQNSVYSESLRAIHGSATAFLAAIDELTHLIVTQGLETVSSIHQTQLQQAYERFEPVLQAELTNQVTYLVQPKGVYDVVALIEDGSRLVPSSIHMRAPEAVRDVAEGAKSMAFELWTAATFHFHRANEAVLRRYFDLCVGTGKRPKPCTMGTMLRNLEQKGAGDTQIIVALQNITKFHRNPISHPDHFVDDAEAAFSLVAAIRAAMGYMLDALPILPFDELMEATPNPNVNAPPLIAAQEGP